jgi:PQQ-dependent dehydrogenase (methanol/ethanol family)
MLNRLGICACRTWLQEIPLLILFGIALPGPGLLRSQNPAPHPAVQREGDASFGSHCAACHGVDASGTSRAPGLAGSRRLRSLSKQQLGELIRDGIPSEGMPAFQIPPGEMDSLVAFVYSLNRPSSESSLPGDPTSGENFFFGTGKCISCHMVFGKGSPIGPDLSDVGHEMTRSEIRKVLLEPDAHITLGYELVIVHLTSGKVLRGFARNRSNFGLQLQDLNGRFYSLQENQIASVREEKKALMQPVKATPEELQNLLAYLSLLTGVKPGATISTRNTEVGLDSYRIPAARPGNWLTYDGNLNGNRYSELTQINTSNVGQLVLKWMSPIRQFGLEVTPLVADGIMYTSGANQAYALDAATGQEIWQYSRPRTPGLVGDASLGTNRGMALLDDKVFMVTDNAHLIALNRVTGHLVWDEVMWDEPQHYGSTVAPLVVKDMVIAGVSGADWGIRGFVAAYKASTGERAWRFWTVPARGEPGYETWQGADPKYGGGGTWVTGSFDSETDTLFWPTATPFPPADDHDRGGDNLFTDCILALDPNTGQLKWHYQYTPHDRHAWDATEPHVLVDAPYQGAMRKLLLHADRNGFFYVFDRTDGQLLLAKNFVKVTWATGIGRDWRPQLSNPGSSELECPAAEAANYDATAFSPLTRLYYVMALEQCATGHSLGHWTTPKLPLESARKYLRALDIESGKVVWEIPQTGTTEIKHWAGILATAGGVLFYGDPAGDVVGVDQRDGKPLWHFPTNEVIKASPITYTVDGKQRIALAVGANVMCFGLP